MLVVGIILGAFRSFKALWVQSLQFLTSDQTLVKIGGMAMIMDKGSSVGKGRSSSRRAVGGLKRRQEGCVFVFVFMCLCVYVFMFVVLCFVVWVERLMKG